jgi:hypothetical protein
METGEAVVRSGFLMFNSPYSMRLCYNIIGVIIIQNFERH